MPSSRYVLLVDIESEWPDVFGPFFTREGAQVIAAALLEDPRVQRVEVQESFYSVREYFTLLDELTEPEEV